MTQPTRERMAQAFTIASEMIRAGVPEGLVLGVVNRVSEFEGLRQLMELWQESESDERDEIVADLQDMLDDIAEVQHLEAPESITYIRFDDLDGIAQDIMAFKDALRRLVDQKGGITKLSEQTGMAQPSLSRFFSSASMPRRATLLKIRDALGLSDVAIQSRWVRGEGASALKEQSAHELAR